LNNKTALLCNCFRRLIDRQTNRQADGHHHRVKPRICQQTLNNGSHVSEKCLHMKLHVKSKQETHQQMR